MIALKIIGIIAGIIFASFWKDGYMFIHPDIKQLRTITMREAALLQSFPLDYIFYGSQNSWYAQIGNAVPVKLAYAIGKGIVKFL